MTDDPRDRVIRLETNLEHVTGQLSGLNCAQHITPRFAEPELAQALAPVR